MIRQKTVLEVEEGDFVVLTECSPDMPLGSLYNALCKQIQFVIQRINEQQPKEIPKEEPKIKVEQE